jgi:hypothetical protein
MATFAMCFQIGVLLSVALLVYGAYLAFVSQFSACEANTRHAPLRSRFRRNGGARPRTEGKERPGSREEQMQPIETGPYRNFSISTEFPPSYTNHGDKLKKAA